MLTGASQTELLCQACAGQCVYDPLSQKLTCVQCGAGRPLETAEDHLAAEERCYDPSFDEPVTLPVETHRCQTCGGDVIFTGPALSERCAYCDGPIVRRVGEEGYETMALIPFRVPEEAAQHLAVEWTERRMAAPDDLAGIVAEGRVAGLYAPFWTFDSDEAVQYWATYKKQNWWDNGTHTRSACGEFSMSFDDLLVPASPHITPLIRDGILHEFDPESLRPYQPGYLAGFAAELHHQTTHEGLDAARKDKDLLIRNRIKEHVGERGVEVTRYYTDSTGIRYRRVLMPVWMLHYRYNGVAMKVVVCGIHGRSFGERPFSTWKLAGYSAAISAAVMAFGLLWGSMGWL